MERVDLETIRVERVAAAATWPLRQRVLRPHQRLDEMAFPGDDDPDTGHFAAHAPDGTVVTVASVRPEDAPWRATDGSPTRPGGDWRLRGMATADGWRGHGTGALVLAAVVQHVHSHGGTLLWCNARLGALRFYERAGLRTHGEPWDLPDLGPHVVMWCPVDQP